MQPRQERPVSVAVPKLGEHRGYRRLWLEGTKLVRAGIEPGQRFSVDWDPASGVVTLTFSDEGDRTVSKRERHNRTMPIIDVGGEQFEAALGEGLERAKVSIYRGRIVVEVHPDDRAARERISRLVERVRSGAPLETGSLAHGGGIIDHALHEGLQEAGVAVRLAFAVEIDQDAIDVAASRNPIWDVDTMQVHAPMETVDAAELPKVDILVAGLPCTGASKAGKARNHNSHTEGHPTAGMLVVPFLQVVKACQPSVVVLENVPDYAHSASAEIIRASLVTWGYDVHETVLDGNEFGALEERRRLCLIGASKELTLDLSALVPCRAKEGRLGDILEDLPPDSERWRSIAHHLEKARKDRSLGRNFKFSLVGPEATTVGTMGAGYSKDRLTEPHVRHPTDPDKARLLTPFEHARAKTVPRELVEGVIPWIAHRILGNSVVWEAWRSVGRHMGEVMTAAAGCRQVEDATNFQEIVATVPGHTFHLTPEATEMEEDLVPSSVPMP